MTIPVPQNVLLSYVVFTVVSAAVSSMPPPTDNSPAWYKWLYKFLNAIMANVSALRGKQNQLDAIGTTGSTAMVSVTTTETKPPDKPVPPA
jgi:hypothetical protein